MTTRYRTNPFFRGGWGQREDDPAFVGNVAGRDPIVGGDDVEKLYCLYWATEPRSRDELVGALVDDLGLDADAAEASFDWLREQEFLLPAAEYGENVTQWIDNGWRFALYYHEYVNGATDGDAGPVEPGGDESSLGGPADRTRTGEDLVELPSPPSFPEQSVGDVLFDRETCRDFSGDSIAAEKLSGLLERGLAGDPGAAAIAARRSTYLNVYPFVARVEGVEPGIYRYLPEAYGLQPVDLAYDAEELDELVTQLIVGQDYAERAAVTLFVTIDWPALRRETTHPRGLRTAYVMTSQLAHVALLAATAYGLDTFQTAAFEDTDIASVLRTNRLREAPGYVLAFGHGIEEER
ncbi:hypothetical protein BRC81_06735 [Halobacteriales archaeon QS_1_68_20]|nr:MAG: hypothetical protein BRC81_06735 [Halobacteriales archaeon QS_1_68_20]